MKKINCFLLYFLLVTSVFAQTPNTNALFPFPDATGKWGYVDAQKNVKIAYQFLGASPFYEERAFIARKEANKTEPTISVIDPTGKILFDLNVVLGAPHELCQMVHYRYSEGLLAKSSFDEPMTVEYLDKEGKSQITLKGVYTANPFSEGLAYVQTNDSTYIYIDKTGKKVLELSGGMGPFDSDFQNGWAVSSKGLGLGECIYINKKGEKAPFLKNFKDVQDLGAMAEGIAFIALSNPNQDNPEPICKLIKPDGSTLPIAIKLGYSSPVTTVSGYRFSNGLALVNAGSGLEGIGRDQVYLNKQGKLAFPMPPVIEQAKNKQMPIFGGNFHQGLACWIIMTGEITYKVVYLTPAGKVAFESTIQKM